MIRTEKLNKYYQSGENQLHVLKDINLSIKEGEFVSIMGASGSGKSTLLSILGILDYMDTGEYNLNGFSVKNLSQTQAAKIRNNFIGFIFQSFNLIPYKSALENVTLPLFYQKIDRKERVEKAINALKQVGLENRINHLPSELSGGQKQRVAIARAICACPKIILADEPTGALDSKTSLAIMYELKKINNNGTTVIIVTHEREIADLTNRKIYLKDGEII